MFVFWHPVLLLNNQLFIWFLSFALYKHLNFTLILMFLNLRMFLGMGFSFFLSFCIPWTLSIYNLFFLILKNLFQYFLISIKKNILSFWYLCFPDSTLDIFNPHISYIFTFICSIISFVFPFWRFAQYGPSKS